MEAPDKESCAAVHREAHGAMPCNIIELQGGDYARYMGEENIKNKCDIVEQPNGVFDTGYRFIMTIDNLPVDGVHSLGRWPCGICVFRVIRVIRDTTSRQ